MKYKAIVLMSFAFLLVGCATPLTFPFRGEPPPVQENKSIGWQKERIEKREPVNPAPAGTERVEITERESYGADGSKGTRALTFRERMGQFFANITAWGVVLVIAIVAACIFVPGFGAKLVFKWFEIRRNLASMSSAYDNLNTTRNAERKALKSVVNAIERMKAEKPDLWEQVKIFLGRTQGEEDEKIIKALRVGLE